MKAALVLATLLLTSVTSNASLMICENGSHGLLASVVLDTAEACSSSLIIQVDGQSACIVDDESRQISSPGFYQVCGVFTRSGFKVQRAQNGMLE